MPGPDLSSLVVVVNVESIVAAVLSVAAGWVVVVLALKGMKMVIGAVGGADPGGRFSQEDWDSMTDDDKSFYGVNSLDDLNNRYRID